jgi:hypothetical protein
MQNIQKRWISLLEGEKKNKTPPLSLEIIERKVFSPNFPGFLLVELFSPRFSDEKKISEV